jgi:phosphoesterase RecJ-like protein
LNTALKIGLTTPDLDGDSVGALGALYHLLSDLPHQPHVCIYTPGYPHPALNRLIHEIPPDHWYTDRECEDQEIDPDPVDVSIVVDGGAHRLAFFKSWFYQAPVRVQIDHHHSANLDGIDLPFVDRKASSTTELIFPLVHALKRPLTPTIAQCIFAGLIFDTSIFRYKLTRPQSLRVAADLLETGIDHALIVEEVLLQKSSNYVQFKADALQKLELSHHQKVSWIQLTKEEMQGQSPAGLIDEITFIEGIEMSILLVEKATQKVKVSLRSRGKVDVSLFASRLNPQGGGHQRAAGATLFMSLDQANSYVNQALNVFLDEFPL